MINLENFSPMALLLMGLLMSALAWWHVQEEQEKDFRRWQNDLLGSRNPDLPVSEWINRWVYRLGLRTILPALAFGGLFVEQFFFRAV